jgi:hypothetical protein
MFCYAVVAMTIDLRVFFPPNYKSDLEIQKSQNAIVSKIIDINLCLSIHNVYVSKQKLHNLQDYLYNKNNI